MTELARLTEVESQSFCEQTLEMEKVISSAFLVLAERLHRIRNEHLYESGWDSWMDFCLEFKELSPSSISKLVSVYQTFIENFGFSKDDLTSAGGWTKLYQISKYVKNKVEAESWLKIAEISSRSDLEKHLKEAKTGVVMAECSHKNTYTVLICEDCGERIRVYEEDKLKTDE